MRFLAAREITFDDYVRQRRSDVRLLAMRRAWKRPPRVGRRRLPSLRQTARLAAALTAEERRDPTLLGDARRAELVSLLRLPPVRLHRLIEDFRRLRDVVRACQQAGFRERIRLMIQTDPLLARLRSGRARGRS